MSLTLQGVLGPVVTNFDPSDGLDRTAFAENIRAHLDAGLRGVVVCGSTGEAALLDEAERASLVEVARYAVPNDRWLIAGSGAESTRTTQRYTRLAAERGADAVLVVAPHYYGSKTALRDHYTAVADESPVPVVLYNIPKYMHFSLAPQLVAELAQHENIIGIKDAGENLQGTAKIIEESAPGFRVWSGNDSDTLAILAVGGYGIVSVASHLIGRQIQAMIQCYLDGRATEAAEIHRRTLPLVQALFVTTNPIPLKYALNRAGFAVGSPRLPLVEPDAKSAALIDAALDRATIDLPVPVGAGAVLG